MTEQKTFKRAVRERMAKTGERYTAARAHLLPDDDGAPPADVPGYEPRMSDDAVRRGSGRGWDEWFALLDGWDAAAHGHKEIATWLSTEHAVPGWWAQGITVEYEKARGLRTLGSGRDGLHTVGASRTVAVPVERLFDAFADPAVRAEWLPGVELRERTARRPRTARFDWEDGTTRLVVGFTAKGDAKSEVSIAHERFAHAGAAAEAKAAWRERLDALKALLEA